MSEFGKKFYEDELVLLIEERERLIIEEENNGASDETAEKIAKLDSRIDYLHNQVKYF